MSGSAANADWRLFLPQLVRTGATVELLGSLESDELVRGSPSSRIEWSDRFAREKLTLFGVGHVYHPRFLIFSGRVAGALKQERFVSSFFSPSGGPRGTASDQDARTEASGLEYDWRVTLLPEHPYNLELFAVRYEPVAKERYAAASGNLETNRGADFRYRREPLRLHGRYDEVRFETLASASRVERLSLDASYLKALRDRRRLSFLGAFNPSRFSDSTGLVGDAREAHVDGFFGGGRLSLAAGAAQNNSDQTDATGGNLAVDSTSWIGRFTGYLPHRLRTDLSYRYGDWQNSVSGPAATGPRQLSRTARQLRFEIAHKLYESLDSTYTLQRDDSQSAGGESSGQFHDLGFAYTKGIPRGRVQAGLNLGRGEIESAGRVDVAGEGHPAVAVPGSFRLGQQNLDPDSVIVLLQSPIEPFETVRLEKGAHYTVIAFAPAVEVSVFALPPRFVVPGSYDFTVSYSLVGGAFALRTDTLNNYGSVELFDDLLNPYYSYAVTRSRVLSGSFPGRGLESSALTGGLRLRRRPFQAVVEVQDVEWDVTPYRSWRVEAQVNGAIGARTNLYALVSRIERSYREGPLGFPGVRYDDRTSSASANLQTYTLSGRVVLSLGGSYSRLEGRFDNRTGAANSTLTWRMGRLELIAAASAYRTETLGGPAIVASRRDHQYYHLKLRRTLF